MVDYINTEIVYCLDNLSDSNIDYLYGGYGHGGGGGVGIGEPLDEDIYFFLDFGEKLTNSVVNVSELLNYEIAGNSLMSLIVGSGFFVYVGWAVLKWVIPS